MPEPSEIVVDEIRLIVGRNPPPASDTWLLAKVPPHSNTKRKRSFHQRNLAIKTT